MRGGEGGGRPPAAARAVAAAVQAARVASQTARPGEEGGGRAGARRRAPLPFAARRLLHLTILLAVGPRCIVGAARAGGGRLRRCHRRTATRRARAGQRPRPWSAQQVGRRRARAAGGRGGGGREWSSRSPLARPLPACAHRCGPRRPRCIGVAESAAPQRERVRARRGHGARVRLDGPGRLPSLPLAPPRGQGAIARERGRRGGRNGGASEGGPVDFLPSLLPSLPRSWPPSCSASSPCPSPP